ncbi:MAG: TIGR03067 domain-containing protein [Planctomycetes bacterium]|nr:TIGR03067 domain-containing protein [Planctomycetota bacterium]
MPAEFVTKQPEAERTITIKGDKIITIKGGKEDAATFKIDSTKTPAEITLTTKKGEKDETVQGIFKVEGDTLTICAAESDKPADRPKEFKTAKDSKTLILTLQKQKDK